jgi:hypothetical protein
MVKILIALGLGVAACVAQVVMPRTYLDQAFLAQAIGGAHSDASQLQVLSGLYGWWRADAGVTNDAGAVVPPGVGTGIWGWGNQSPNVGARAEGAAYTYQVGGINCTDRNPSDTDWTAGTGPNGLPSVNCRNNKIPLAAGRCTGSAALVLPLTICMLVKQDAGSTRDNYLWTNEDVGSTNYNLVFDYNNSYGAGSNALIMGYDPAARSPGLVPVTITNWTVLTCCYNGTNSYVRTNGVNAYPVFTTSTSAISNNIYLLNYHGGNAHYFQGKLAEIMFYTGAALSTNDLRAAETYLGLRGGVRLY